MPLTSGETFAGYTIVRLLGSGGMGEVYLAKHPRLPRHDALKVLPPGVSSDTEFRERFNREADLAAALYHPHIVGVHDRGEDEGHLWISMDFVDGPDSAQFLRTRYPTGMPRDAAIDIVAAVADALDYAHKRGLLHRDVKPANILLAEPGKDDQRILLADFGIARLLDDVSGLTATNMTVGTVIYAAPEQLTDVPVDGRADQYSLAATAYHLLTGAPPFAHSNPAVVIGQHLTASPPKPSDKHGQLADLDAPFATALSKNPRDRYESCRDFAAALAGKKVKPPASRSTVHTAVAMSRRAPVVEAPPPVAEAPPPVAEVRSEPAPERVHIRPSIVVSIAAALAIVAVAATYALTRDTDADQPSNSPSTSMAAPPASTPSTQPQPVDPRLSGPVTGTSCRQGQWNETSVSREGTTVRCFRSDNGAYSWETDRGEQLDPSIITTIGYDGCMKQHETPSCFEAARAVAGAPPDAPGPLVQDGIWAVPNWVAYGDYDAAVGPSGTCWWYGYDSNGRIADSGHFTRGSDKPHAFVTPMMSSFQTVGCTPWFQTKPLDPNW
jgi:serine/threonine protein kinase